jgi:CubicO group peptidase (beta-lactamase class C family)
MIRSLRAPIIAVCGVSLLAGCQPALKAAPGRAEIEARLIPAVTIVGDDYSAYSLEERREVYRVPSVTVAVGRNGASSWAGAYGAAGNPDTLFQAASLSKTVAAAGILRLAAERGTDFDADIAGDLPMLDWEAINPEGRPVTLRGLLSHTAGATVGGFPGYSVDEEVPTNLEVIQGSDRTNTDAVIIDFDPDNPRRYAGGGYQIAQLWAETVSGEAFPELMRRLVLDPVGMERSTFVQDRPEPDGSGYAFAHDGDGAPIEGGWHVYPELAAAGLWTTAPEYLRFALALMAAEGGDETVGVSPEIARAMSTPVVETFALGMGSEISFEERRWRKGGSNRGFRSYVMMFPDRGDAIVVMTNGDNGFPMLGDINRTANQVYGWPALEPRREERFPVDPAALDRLAGTYLFGVSGDPILELTVGEGELSGRFNGGDAFRLVPISVDVFIDPNDAQEVSFEVGEGTVTARSQGYVFTKPAD